MKEDLRGLIERLEKAGEVARVRKEVDPRYISALVAKSPKAMVFERVRGYEMAMVGGLITTRRRQALSLGVGEAEVGLKFLHAMDNRIDPVIVKESPAQEVVHTGSQVDLTSLPIPLLHRKDGGPYITTGIVVAKDYKGRRNAGMYRLMYRTPTETGIDLVSPSDLRFIYQRALEEGKALPVAVAMGCHPAEMFATSYKAPPGEDEFSVAGGLRGEPVELVACKTVELEVPASAEVVLEGELLPVGWTVDEGGFGDFTGHQCTIRWNPIFRVKAITSRARPLFYTLHMPWENQNISGPPLEAGAWRVLREASIDTRAVYATPGSCCKWHLVAAIRKRPGEGKNALLALLSLGEVKLAIVTDDDVDIFDPLSLERALTFRVQADEDVIILSGARGKHLDPSLKASKLPKGSLPTTAKMGIDATIPEGVDIGEYEMAEYAFREEVRVEDYT